MRSGTFWLILLIVFAGSFLWAGGAGLPKDLASQAAFSKTDADSAWVRVWRVFALKSAVEAKIDRQQYTRLADIPLALQQAVIAVEDHRFYRHIGLDVEGILRAALVNLQSGALQEGASTITQQLVKNLFLSSDKTWGRKFEEMVLALDMEMRYSKEEILELYLNTVYFGSGAKGITPAAQIYFGKNPAQLTLAESALLAGLPNAPSYYSPHSDYAAAKQRQAVVLAAMTRHGYIGPAAAAARQAPLNLVARQP